MSRRALAVSLGLAVALVIPTALSGPVAVADDGIVDRVTQLHASSLVRFGPGLKPTSITPMSGAEVVLDAAGNVVEKLPFQAKAQPHRTFGFTGPCVADGNREGMAPGDPVTYTIDERNEKGSFTYHPYGWDNARRNKRDKQMFQVLICGVGGVDAGGGSRLRVSGPGMAYNDAGHPNTLARRWKEGSTPEDYSLSLGFEVPARGVNITGSITQHPSNHLRGSVVPPYAYGDMADFHVNAVNAWWEDGCRPRCTRFGGSNHYQGSVAEGLWEFPQASRDTALARGFRFATYMEHHCSNPFGC